MSSRDSTALAAVSAARPLLVAVSSILSEPTAQRASCVLQPILVLGDCVPNRANLDFFTDVFAGATREGLGWGSTA